jgi:hypothetical protein
MWRGTTVAVKKLLQEEMDESSYQEFLKEIETMRCIFCFISYYSYIRFFQKSLFIY